MCPHGLSAHASLLLKRSRANGLERVSTDPYRTRSMNDLRCETHLGPRTMSGLIASGSGQQDASACSACSPVAHESHCRPRDSISMKLTGTGSGPTVEAFGTWLTVTGTFVALCCS